MHGDGSKDEKGEKRGAKRHPTIDYIRFSYQV